MTYEKLFSSFGGILGLFITFCFGSWDKLLYTTIFLMGIDYITGLVKHFSPKYDKSKEQLSSKKGLWGFFKKACYILIIAIGFRLDILLEINLIRDCCCYFFIVNELLSILENFGEMGVPFPKIITQYIEILKEKVDK